MPNNKIIQYSNIDKTLSFEEAKVKTEKLAFMMNTVKDILQEYLTTEEQRQRLSDFCIDIVSIADAEICFERNMSNIAL